MQQFDYWGVVASDIETESTYRNIPLHSPTRTLATGHNRHHRSDTGDRSLARTVRLSGSSAQTVFAGLGSGGALHCVAQSLRPPLLGFFFSLHLVLRELYKLHLFFKYILYIYRSKQQTKRHNYNTHDTSTVKR